MNCILCSAPSRTFYKEPKSAREYLHCETCDLRFLNPSQRLSPAEEKTHYLNHENNVEDVRYQNFMKPVFETILSLADAGSSGLDYGCGTGPVLAKMLTEHGILVDLYDPFFAIDDSVLKKKYDFVACTEVAEHFHFPQKEFGFLKSLLVKDGFLALMTEMHRPDIDFSKWHYPRDPTHATFYSKHTFAWLSKAFGFSKLWTDEKKIIVMHI